MQNLTDSRNTTNNIRQPISTNGDLVNLRFTEVKEVAFSFRNLSRSEYAELAMYIRVKKFSRQRLLSKAVQAFEALGGRISAAYLSRFNPYALTFVVWDVFERNAEAILAAA